MPGSLHKFSARVCGVHPSRSTLCLRRSVAKPCLLPRPSSLCYFSSVSSLSDAAFKEDLKSLRSRTGAPLKECKKALSAVLDSKEAESDSEFFGENGSEVRVEHAIDWLRVSGVKVASKKAGQTAANGFVSIVNLNHQKAAIVEVNCVTDFVEKNPLFVRTVENIAYTVASHDDCLQRGQFTQNLALISNEHENDGDSSAADKQPCSEEEKSAMRAMSNLTVFDLESQSETNQKLGESLTDIISSIRENLVFRRFCKMQASSVGVICHYVHSRSTPNCGMKGGLVKLEPLDPSTSAEGLNADDRQSLIELGTNIAMHAVTNGNRPQFMREEDVPEQIIERERKVAMDTALSENSDLPAEKLLKIVDGRMKKYLSEICLCSQTYCLADDSSSSVPISKLVDKTCKSLRIPPMKIVDFQDVQRLVRVNETLKRDMQIQDEQIRLMRDEKNLAKSFDKLGSHHRTPMSSTKNQRRGQPGRRQLSEVNADPDSEMKDASHR